MTAITRWDNGATIYEHDGDVRATVEAAAKLGILCFGASLVGAKLDGARLVRANLDGSNLDGASLIGANLDGANLDGANLAGARLVGASLVGASLVGASLVGANLDGANLDGANLAGANLAGARLVRASLVGANLDGARLPIWCKWSVTYAVTPSLVINIGCKTKSIQDWDSWFAGNECFDTPRDTEEFRRIVANYQAVRAYLVAMGVTK